MFTSRSPSGSGFGAAVTAKEFNCGAPDDPTEMNGVCCTTDPAAVSRLMG